VSPLPPVHREIGVDAAPDVAFEVFTEQLGRWWPLADHSVHGPGSMVAFEAGRIVERSGDGEIAVWGSVTEWSPGRRVRFTWHPGQEPDRAGAVTVRFDRHEEGTLVVLEHHGWEVYAEPDAARSEYDRGWPTVLGRFADFFAASAAWTWVALMHVPAAPAETGSVFADPRFTEHLAFLRRMDAAGYLVAAGPFTEPAGAGMTILRLPGGDRYEEAVRLATCEDDSVVGGLFRVEVRPWQVAMHTVPPASQR